MSRGVALLLMLATCLVCTGRASAQLDQPDALKTYRTIWEGVPEALWEAVTDLRAVSPAWRAERASSQLFVRHLETVERLADATRLQASTPQRPGTDQWDQAGADVRNFRRTAYLFAVDATRLRCEGDADGAAARIGAILRLAGQLAWDGHTESTGLAVTCVELVDEQADLVCQASTLTERGRHELRLGLAALDPEDPVGLLRCFERVRALTAWVREHCAGAGAGETLVAALPIPEDRKRVDAEAAAMEGFERRRGGRRGQTWPSRQLIAEIRAMDADALHEAARQAERMLEVAVASWDEPDAEGMLRSIDFSAERNVYGPLVRLSPPNFSRQRRTADRVALALERIGAAVIAKGR